jgi:hypothetical protein
LPPIHRFEPGLQIEVEDSLKEVTDSRTFKGSVNVF